ncbi:zinc finger MYM-type protein 1 [Trichonephila clavipes]|nr:zinc finger MYM-type protein 1 [Trichonephila clavipes]
MNSAIVSDSNNVTAFGVANAPRVEVRAHGEKYAARTLNILQLNINGTQRKIEDLTEILNVNKVHITCLQETKLNPNLKLKIKGFTTLRKDRKDRPGGSLAFLVKSADTKFREITLPPTTDCDENSTEAHVVKEGCCDWKDLSRILQRHEESQGDMECMIKWMEFYKEIKHGKTINKDNERLIKESQKYWDVSRVEQMSIILRFCNSSTGAIEEHFVGFIAFEETAGEYITNSILQELERNGLDIQNCRGQGYDNGANMVGINKGVRTRILNINPTAFFTPGGCHNWNLLLIDAANSSATAKTFFGFINKIYVLFSKPSKRWDIVKTKLKLTL